MAKLKDEWVQQLDAAADFMAENEPGAIAEIFEIESAFLGGTLEELGHL
ncbi:hypothetical protein [Kribbella sindirgiensis]|nr:hypothetical protein [Kribbella sindirgiensis]